MTIHEITVDELAAAIDAGATLGTHLLNAMPPIKAREPGIAGVLLSDARTHFGVISDGRHHHPSTLALMWNAAPDRFIAITDAMAASGMPDGEYSIGTVDVALHDGVVTNAEGTLAGAASLLDRNLRILMDTTDATLNEAIKSVTFNPSEAIGRWDLGRLRRGARGDITLLDGTSAVGRAVSGRSARPRLRGTARALHPAPDQHLARGGGSGGRGLSGGA